MVAFVAKGNIVWLLW